MLADFDETLATTDVPRVQLPLLRLEHLNGQPNVILADIWMLRRRQRWQLVDEFLAIVKIAQDVLALLEVSNHALARIESGDFANFGGVAEPLQRNPRGVNAVRKVHARGVPDRLVRGVSAFDDHPSKLLPPLAGEAGPGTDAIRKRMRDVVEQPLHLDPLEPFDQLSHPNQALTFVLLTHDHERWRHGRNAGFDVQEERDSNVGVAHASEAAPDPSEPPKEVIHRIPPVPFLGQRQHLANPPRRHARIVNALDVPIEDARELLQKIVDLALQDPYGRGGLEHDHLLDD